MIIADDEQEELYARVLSTIQLCPVNYVLFNIVEENSSTSLWSKLEILYMTKSVTNIIQLKRQLYSMRMKEGTKITNYFNAFITLIFQLNSMDVKIDDEDKATNFLCTLPKSWG